jgi:hypothetical protein
MDLILKGVVLCIGVFLLLKAPHDVSSTDQEIAKGANPSFLVCLIVALAINLWRLPLALWPAVARTQPHASRAPASVSFANPLRACP